METDNIRNNYLSFDKIKIKKENNKENQQESLLEKYDDIRKEKLLLDYHTPISLKKTEKITDQLKNSLCNIYLGSKGSGTGFFMKIKFPDNEHLLPVLVTCNHVIDGPFLSENDEINIEINGKNKTIQLKNRIIYTNKEIDITIIEINEKQDDIKNFLILDEENQNFKISGKTIYILQYFEADGPSAPSVPSVSYGILQYFDKLKFEHHCSTNLGSSGSPILNLATNKVIGIHIGANNSFNYNVGIFLNNPINDFIKKMYNNKIEENEIQSLMNQPTKKVNMEERSILTNEDYNKNENNNFSLINMDSIMLEKKSMDEYDISYINNIFINIRVLNLTNNNIPDINILEKVKFEKLEKLCLDNNKISDINILEKVKLKNLKEVYLNGNNISNIEILEKVNFPNLEILDLSCNKIINIDVFEKVNFPKLKMLSFHKNKVSKIDKIKLAKLENLNLLALSHNERIDISSLKDVKFKNLIFLFLADINVKKIDIFSSFAFKHLKLLTLGGNNISNIKVLSHVDFKELEDLILYDNSISDIEVLAEVNFPKLKILNLSSNLITNIEVLKDVNFPELNELDLQQNNIVDINVFKNCKFKKLVKLNIKLNKIDMNKNMHIIKEFKCNLIFSNRAIYY